MMQTKHDKSLALNQVQQKQTRAANGKHAQTVLLYRFRQEHLHAVDIWALRCRQQEEGDCQGQEQGHQANVQPNGAPALPAKLQTTSLELVVPQCSMHALGLLGSLV